MPDRTTRRAAIPDSPWAKRASVKGFADRNSGSEPRLSRRSKSTSRVRPRRLLRQRRATSSCPTSSTDGSNPGRVFDRLVGLDEVPDGYRAMNDRESIKVMVNPT
jgi:hypothetical protein